MFGSRKTPWQRGAQKSPTKHRPSAQSMTQIQDFMRFTDDSFSFLSVFAWTFEKSGRETKGVLPSFTCKLEAVEKEQAKKRKKRQICQRSFWIWYDVVLLLGLNKKWVQRFKRTLLEGDLVPYTGARSDLGFCCFLRLVMIDVWFCCDTNLRTQLKNTRKYAK